MKEYHTQVQVSSGTILAQTPPGKNKCGTTATGWSKGALPETGVTNTIKVTCC